MVVQALAIVQPSVANILAGTKIVEIRSWPPPRLPLRNLVLVENEIYLREESQEDPNGHIRAVVDITGLHPWTREEASAQGKDWQPGYLCWEIERVRPVDPPIPCIAKRRIYAIDVTADLPL